MNPDRVTPAGRPIPSRLSDLCAAVEAALSVADVMLRAGRSVDLGGLERAVGRLCAAALDLPPDDGRAARPHLAALLARLDALEAPREAR